MNENKNTDKDVDKFEIIRAIDERWRKNSYNGVVMINYAGGSIHSFKVSPHYGKDTDIKQILDTLGL